MNIKRLYITILIGVLAIAAHATDFDCKINFANGLYNGKSEEEMIKLNTTQFGNDTWAKLWEKKKTELHNAFIFAFCKKGTAFHLRGGSFPNSAYQININVISIDPDGEINAHVLAYLNDSTTGELNIYLDEAFSGDGKKDAATYTNLSTEGFAKLGTKLAISIGTRMSSHQRENEKIERQKAKQAEIEAEEAKYYAENPTNPEEILISMLEEDIEGATLIRRVNITKTIETTEGETRLQCYEEIKEKASLYGATLVYIEKVMKMGKKLTIYAIAYKK